jgi:hypothetical protein
MNDGLDAFNEIATSTDRVAKAAGVAAGVGAPPAAVAVTAFVAEVSGGAAILKTLAIAGSLVGGGALAGITILGVGAVGVGWGTMKVVQRIRAPGPTGSGK